MHEVNTRAYHVAVLQNVALTSHETAII